LQIINNIGETKEFEMNWDNVGILPESILVELEEKNNLNNPEIIVKNAILLNKKELFRLMTYMYIENKN